MLVSIILSSNTGRDISESDIQVVCDGCQTQGRLLMEIHAIQIVDETYYRCDNCGRTLIVVKQDEDGSWGFTSKVELEVTPGYFMNLIESSEADAKPGDGGTNRTA